ncbi:hypothetical protein [Sphingomonas sp. UYEF23]|uniref:ParB/RepB/Spo0J family partition protein n=1 Tax=Sphingomonas sp. UYEF23 TaxID=1756408 RepID=UPI00339A0F7A
MKSVRERESLQMRAGPLAPLHINALAGAMLGGQEVPPIKVARIGKALFVVDGFHRLAAARSLGREGIEALVAPMGLEAAEAFARVANVGHGRNLTRHDKQRSWESYVKAGAHLDSLGAVKSSRAIAAELRGMYGHATVMRKLREAGFAPNRALDAAEGSKWSGRYDNDDGGEDIDDLADGATGPLDAEGVVEALGHLQAVETLYFGSGDWGRSETLGAVRKLLGRLEANVTPAVPEETEMDI